MEGEREKTEKKKETIPELISSRASETPATTVERPLDRLP